MAKSDGIMKLSKALYDVFEKLDLRRQRKLEDQISLLAKRPKNISYVNFNIGSMSCSWVRPYASPPSRKVILHCHGGAFWTGTIKYAQVVASRIAACSGVDTLTFAYRLSPENPYPAALQDTVRAYRYLLNLGYPPEAIVVCGESAGGNLVLALSHWLKKEGYPLPSALVCLSPWIDLAGKGESHITLRDKDPTLDSVNLMQAARWYAGELSLDDSRISPLYGDFTGFPRTLIHVGSLEILLSDSLQLYDKMNRSGVDVTLEVYEDMWHVFQMFPVEEAKASLRKIGAFIRVGK